MYSLSHKIHLSDTDVTGQVYYARPLEWLEWCRVNWFEEQYGNFLNYVSTNNITFFPSQVKIDYKKPLFFGDSIQIQMTVKEIKKVSFVFNYSIRRGEETVIQSEIVMVCFDTQRKSLTKLNEDLLHRLSVLLS